MRVFRHLLQGPSPSLPCLTDANVHLEEKARKEMAAKAGGKGPLNLGGQGIKGSSKKK